MKFTNFFRHPWDIYLFAAFSSILLSIGISLHEVVVNPDAICYLKSAETFALDGMRAAMRLCDQAKWPFYSYLIYQLAKITHISYTAAAFTLDGIFSFISVMTFITIVRLLENRRSIIWFAAIVILLAHEFNSTRQYIVRDHGFWAFYLMSVFFILKFMDGFKIRFALGWSFATLIATLFRVEGAIFLLFAPLITFFDTRVTWMTRIQSFLKLNIISAVVAVIFLIGFLQHPEKGMAHFGRIPEIQNQLLNGAVDMVRGFHDRAEALKHYVLGMNAARDAFTIMFLVVIASYLMNVINNVSLIYAGLIAYAWWKRLVRVPRFQRMVLWGFVILNLIVTFVFFVENMFLSKRYLIALSLILMMWLPFALDDLLRRFRLYFTVQKIYGLFPVVIALVIISSLGGIFDFGYSKTYIRNAGEWLAQNAPESSAIYSNDYQVMYYSKHFESTIFKKSQEYADISMIQNNGWKKFDYVVLQFSKKELDKDPIVLQEIAMKPVQVFANKRGDQVSIYKINRRPA